MSITAESATQSSIVDDFATAPYRIFNQDCELVSQLPIGSSLLMVLFYLLALL